MKRPFLVVSLQAQFGAYTWIYPKILSLLSPVANVLKVCYFKWSLCWKSSFTVSHQKRLGVFLKHDRVFLKHDRVFKKDGGLLGRKICEWVKAFFFTFFHLGRLTFKRLRGGDGSESTFCVFPWFSTQFLPNHSFQAFFLHIKQLFLHLGSSILIRYKKRSEQQKNLEPVK